MATPDNASDPSPYGSDPAADERALGSGGTHRGSTTRWCPSLASSSSLRLQREERTRAATDRPARSACSYLTDARGDSEYSLCSSLSELSLSGQVEQYCK